MNTNPASREFREDLLVEFEIAERQILGLASAMPADKFSWRPHDTARTVSEVFIHIAAGNFYILQFAGRAVPADVYGDIPAEGEERIWGVARRNDELEKQVTAKADVLKLLTRSLQAARDAMSQADASAFGESSMRRVFLRMIAHLHEHMGQMIAYTRANRLRVPWQDWRPDRR